MKPLARKSWTQSSLLLFPFVVLALSSCAGAGLKAPEKSRPAPSYSFPGLDGGIIHLEDHLGKVVLLNVWASWCGPCRREMPGFEKVYQEYKDDGFVILGVAQDNISDLAKVRRFAAETGVTYPIGYDPVTDFADFSGRPVRAIPTSFLIDQQGRVRLTKVGLLRDNVLRKALTPLLARDPVGER